MGKRTDAKKLLEGAQAARPKNKSIEEITRELVERDARIREIEERNRKR
jgi:hypothetical protein